MMDGFPLHRVYERADTFDWGTFLRVETRALSSEVDHTIIVYDFTCVIPVP